jgi:hypothetical protein
MGYNFIISSVAVAVSDIPGYVDIDVNVTQSGVAPFYYPLSLVLDCSALDWPRDYGGVETIISERESKLFSFERIPATSECLGNVAFRLSSPYAYEGRPIKFAQGLNGTVSLILPTPPLADAKALLSPVPPPASNVFLIPYAVPIPVRAPVKAPTIMTDSMTASRMVTRAPNLVDDDIHAFNTPNAPPLLNLEAKQRRKFSSQKTTFIAFAAAVALAIVLVAFIVVKRLRHDDEDSEKGGQQQCHFSDVGSPPTTTTRLEST